jgi:hypothetical protein
MAFSLQDQFTNLPDEEEEAYELLCPMILEANR